MRVSAEQVKIFDRYAHQYFGDDASIWLFGSRVDDQKRGGDYGFFIETALMDADEIVRRKIALLVDLQETAPFDADLSGCDGGGGEGMKVEMHTPHYRSMLT